MRRNMIIGAVAVVAWVALSVVLLFVVCQEDATSVPCPTEDSCAVDYHDGAWHIVPAVP